MKTVDYVLGRGLRNGRLIDDKLGLYSETVFSSESLNIIPETSSETFVE